jgi:hypothetical protein
LGLELLRAQTTIGGHYVRGHWLDSDMKVFARVSAMRPQAYVSLLRLTERLDDTRRGAQKGAEVPSSRVIEVRDSNDVPPRTDDQGVEVLFGVAGRDVRSALSVMLLVPGPGVVEAEPPVGTASNQGAVVVVLPVVFPSALAADLVTASLAESRVAAARTRIGHFTRRGIHVQAGGVRLEPGTPSFE